MTESSSLIKEPFTFLAKTLKYLGGVMGFLQEDPLSFLQTGFAESDKAAIDLLIEERLQARANKNWTRADQIRAELLSQGIELEDGEKGTFWRRVSE